MSVHFKPTLTSAGLLQEPERARPASAPIEEIPADPADVLARGNRPISIDVTMSPWWQGAFRVGISATGKVSNEPGLLAQLGSLVLRKRGQYQTTLVKLNDQEVFALLGTKPLDAATVGQLREAASRGWLSPLALRVLDYPDFVPDLEQLLSTKVTVSTDDLASLWTEGRAFSG